MAAGRAELIYVGGPQAGQRAAMTSAVVTVGRGREADVQLTEEHVSRQHFQLTLTRDGWVFENLSTLKSRINGKRFKAGKKIILDTGDVIAVGAETELLFVSADDDTEAALIAYRQSGARKGKSRPAPASPTVASAKDRQIEPNGAASPSPPEDEEEAELSPEEAAELAQKAKYKKYAVVFGSYMALLLVGVVIITTLFDRPQPAKRGRPTMLKEEQIDDLISVKLHRDDNSAEARIALKEAMLALDRTNKIDYLYQAVYWFKLSRAYGRAFDAEEERIFGNAKRLLTKTVQEKYRNAYAFARDHKYVTAEAMFQDLLAMLPSMGRREEKTELRKNIVAHLAYIKRVSAKNKKR
jgi:pSer/pThr/pTyr-binding forkhead associated (FHA) protein